MLNNSDAPLWMYQALPPLAGTPAEFISECCQYDSRRQHAAAKFIIKGTSRQLPT